MAQPLLTTCGLNEATIPPVTLIKQDSGVDGSFLIAAILGHRLKTSKDHRVLLIATHHNYTHYSSACLKLTYNLGPSRDSGQLQTLDIGAELFQNFPAAGPTLDDLQKRIEDFLQSSPNQATILIDDLTFFLNLGHTECQLIDFIEVVTDKLTSRPNYSLVIKLNTADLYDVLAANLDDLAATELRLERLTSGNFREVDGRLTVSRMKQEGSLVQRKQPDRQVLFKVNERNVRVFVPGELGIKNL